MCAGSRISFRVLFQVDFGQHYAVLDNRFTGQGGATKRIEQVVAFRHSVHIGIQEGSGFFVHALHVKDAGNVSSIRRAGGRTEPK